jgi:hypothetical protein
MKATRMTVLTLVLAVGGCGPASVTRDVEDPPRMVEVILGRIPVGTPLSEAERFMTSEGFACRHTADGAFLDRRGLSYLSCDRSTGVVVQRRWQVAIGARDGKVDEVLASTGLIGP